MVSAPDSGSGGPGSSPVLGHCVVFLGKTLQYHSASLHPGVQMSTSKCAGGNPAMDQHPIQGNSNTPSRFMLRKPELSTGPVGHLGPYRGFYFFTLLIQKGLSLSLSGSFDQRPKVFCKNYTANSLLMASSLQPSHYVKPFCRFYVYSRQIFFWYDSVSLIFVSSQRLKRFVHYLNQSLSDFLKWRYTKTTAGEKWWEWGRFPR